MRKDFKNQGELMIACNQCVQLPSAPGVIQCCLNYCRACFLLRKAEKDKLGRLCRGSSVPPCAGFPSSHASEQADIRLFGDEYMYWKPDQVEVNRPWLKKCSGCKGLWYLDKENEVVSVSETNADSEAEYAASGEDGFVPGCLV